MDRSLGLAAVQFEPTLFRKAENTEALARLASEAAAKVGPGGLVVLPEMAVTGYVFRSREEIAPFVEPIPGPTTKLFGRVARRAGCSVVLGLPEVDPDTRAYYNSAALLGPDGEVAGRYRKTHSFHADTLWAAEGDLGLPVFSGPWPGPLGLEICMDAGFFEAARVQALAGARVIAFPANWLRAAPSPEWLARAFENGVYFVAANRWGEERGARFAGGSCVIGPDGTVFASLDRGDGVVSATMPPSGKERGGAGVGATASRAAARTGLATGTFACGVQTGRLVRRPDLYHPLLSHPQLWPHRFVYGEGLGRGPLWLGAVGARFWDLLLAKGSRRGWALDENDLARFLSGLPGEPGRRLLVLPPCPAGAGDPVATQAMGKALARAAAARGVYLVVSLASGDPGEPEREVRLVGPETAGVYRSPHVHLSRACDAFPVFDLPFARVALLDTLDLLLPEAVRLAAKRGADVVAASGAWPGKFAQAACFLFPERAETNDVWLAVAATWNGGPAAGAKAGAGVASGVGADVGPAGGIASVFGVSLRPGCHAAVLGSGKLEVSGAFAETGPDSPTRRKERLRRLRPDLYVGLVKEG